MKREKPQSNRAKRVATTAVTVATRYGTLSYRGV